MTVRVITNNQPRDLIDAYELTPAERAEFDYLDWDAVEDGRESGTFFRYKGRLYDLSEFMRTDMPGWDGLAADSAFTATVVRYEQPWCERVIVGRVLS